MISKNVWTISNAMHNDLLLVKTFVYDRCGFHCTHPTPENESVDYGAYTFKINGKSVRYRISKITPTKTGQFVTIWKRNGNGPIEPFEISDDIDLVIISTRNNDHFGQFVFPKSVLVDKRIFSGNIVEGKRGIRVYPPWDRTTNRQAQKTQQWQLEYFLEIPSGNSIDLARAKKLYR